MSDNIFGEATPPAQAPAQAPAEQNTQAQPSPLNDLLKGIVNERGEPKYATVEEALKGAAHAQSHIRDQANSLRDREARDAQRDAELESLKAQVAKFTQPKQTEEPPPAQKGLSEDEIGQMLERRLTAREQEVVAKTNQQQVVKAMQAAFGEQAQDVFYQKAQELGLDEAAINTLAARSPQAVLTMFGVKGAPANSGTMAPIQTRQNTQVEIPNGDTSFIGREKSVSRLGEGHERTIELMENAKKMVEELRAKGMSVDDLTNPKSFHKFMK